MGQKWELNLWFSKKIDENWTLCTDQSPLNKPRLIIDTDPGHDDAIALILAHHFADVLGITTVAGNTTVENGTRNAIRICDLLATNTPVHRGASAPIAAESQFASEVHGEDGLGGIELPEPSRNETSDEAIEYLLETVEPDVWVVAVGPLTNIAQVLMRDPSWFDRIAGLSLMGGSARGGNVTASAEFNMYFDPEAADIVFRSNGKTQMSGINLTHQVQISKAELKDVVRADPDSPRTRFIDQNFDRIIESLRALSGTTEVAMHDPCAVLAVTHPELFDFIRREVTVELNGTLTRGMTVVDERFRVSETESKVEVGYEVKAAAVKQLIFEVLYGNNGLT